MAVSKNNKACRRDGSLFLYTKGELRDQGRPKQEEEPTKNKTRQDPSRQVRDLVRMTPDATRG